MKFGNHFQAEPDKQMGHTIKYIDEGGGHDGVVPIYKIPYKFIVIINIDVCIYATIVLK